MTVRKIEDAKVSNIGSMDTDDTDGVRSVYEVSGGNVIIGDLAGHPRRVVFKHTSDEGLRAKRHCRDFSTVWLCFNAQGNNPAHLAVIKTDGPGYRELIRDDPDGAFLAATFL